MQFFTFNNIIDLFKTFVENHYQLQRFGNGEIADIEELISKEQSFPILWSNLIDITYPSENLKSFRFNILIFDILKNDKSNEQEIWSDSVQIAEDFIRYLKWNASNYYDVIDNSTINIFTERFSDFVGGCNLNITIQTDSNLQNDCGIPMDGFEFSIPSFILSGDSTASSFSCSDLLGCDLFTAVSGQTETNKNNIIILSGNQSNFITNSVFSAYTGNTNTIFNTYTGNTSNTINGLQTSLNSLSASTSAYTTNSVFNTYTGNTNTILNNKVNKSGDTMTGGLITPSLSATSISATTYFSGGTPLTTIINNIASQYSGQTGTLGTTVDGGGSILVTGSTGYFLIPYNLTFTDWYINSDTSGSVQFDIKLSGTSIIGSGNKPKLVSQQSNYAVISGWTTTSLSIGNLIQYTIDSTPSITNGTLSLKFNKV